MNTKPKLLIFDVNETLLDMMPLKSSVNEALKDEKAFDAWFPMLLHYSLVETLTDGYHDFSEIAGATFKMLAEKWGISYTEEEIKKILDPIDKLPPYADVPKGLEKFKKAGIPMIALTNGKPEVAEAQLKYANIDRFFDRVVSVEVVKKYKPHPDPYQYVLEQNNCSAKDAIMVAAHAWDLAGAKSHGLQTAFIERAGKTLYPLLDKPDFQATSIRDFSGQILAI